MSDYTNGHFEKKYKDSFNARMFKRKRINLDSLYLSSPMHPKIEEEVIEIKRR